MTNEQMIAGALFDLMGFLTCSETRWKFSAYDDATPAIEALRQFAEKRGLNLNEARVIDWQSALAASAQTETNESHPYERDLEGLNEFIKGMCQDNPQLIAIATAAWYKCIKRNHPANAASAQAEPTQTPSPELTWLYSHCRAIGMTCKSDSGKWEQDIALFTQLLKDEIASLKAEPAQVVARPDEAMNRALNYLSAALDESPVDRDAALKAREILDQALHAASLPQPSEQTDKPVAKVRVTHKGYGMELSTYIAYALPEGMHDLYAAPLAKQAEQPQQLTDEQKDAARLDWLEQRPDHFANIDRITSVAGKFNDLPSLRDAIDAAMSGKDAVYCTRSGNKSKPLCGECKPYGHCCGI